MLLKVLIVLILIGYIFNKVVSFIFRGSVKNFSDRNQYNNQRYTRNTRKVPNSNLNIDNIPNRSSKKRGGFGGGEYVDYEEVN